MYRFHGIFLLEFASWNTSTPEEDQNTVNKYLMIKKDQKDRKGAESVQDNCVCGECSSAVLCTQSLVLFYQLSLTLIDVKVTPVFGKRLKFSWMHFLK